MRASIPLFQIENLYVDSIIRGKLRRAHRFSVGNVTKPGSASTTDIFKKVLARAEREFFIDNLLARVHFIIVMIRWTGLAPWESEFPFPPGQVMFDKSNRNYYGTQTVDGAS